MRMDQKWLFGTLLLALSLPLAGCPTVPPANEPDDDLGCRGDRCLTEVSSDLVDDKGGAGELEVRSTDADGTGPIDEVACDQCQEGQIKCLGDDRYNPCVKQGACWVWDPFWVQCKGQKVCTCTQLPEAPEVCSVEVGGECTCIPDCLDKECGADGCGGECPPGCEEGLFCVESAAGNSCELGGCDGCPPTCVLGDSKCNDAQVQYCIDINSGRPDCKECLVYGPSEECFDPLATCNSDTGKCECPFTQCGQSCCQNEGEVCGPGDACCAPKCSGKVCGDNGCGGVCGECEAGKFCAADQKSCTDQCLSDCTKGDKFCNDALTGFKECQEVIPGCWQKSPWFGCAAGTSCNPATGQCQCTPNCKNKVCGDDGCGGSCGDCPGPYDICKLGKCACDCTGKPAGVVCDTTTNTEYFNACEATCAGSTNWVKGTCPKCQDDCTANELKPMEICGYDMVTYPNFCELKCAIGGDSCISTSQCPALLYPGACKPDCCEDKGCSGKYTPVCGSDGQTYCNKCAAQLCPSAPGVQISCFGECLNASACPACSNECAPVCGLYKGKKKEYRNECAMECQGATWVWDGSCCLDCPDVDDWICAKEGDTFQAHQNGCLQNCKEPSQIELYSIPLLYGELWIDVCEKCKCDLSQAAPICGDNFVTYANDCALQCDHDSDPVDPPVSDMPWCEAACFSTECPCPPETGGLAVPSQVKPGDDGLRGVCGLDGNTYGNECHAAKFGTAVASFIWCEECETFCGDAVANPVCCDGVTYPNSCVPEKCNDLIDIATACKKGKCCLSSLDCDDGNPATVDTCSKAGVCENN